MFAKLGESMLVPTWAAPKGPERQPKATAATDPTNMLPRKPGLKILEPSVRVCIFGMMKPSDDRKAFTKPPIIPAPPSHKMRSPTDICFVVTSFFLNYRFWKALHQRGAQGLAISRFDL